MKATISKESPRYQDWLEVFGTDTVEIMDPALIPAGSDEVCRLDLRQLSRTQAARMVNFLCQRYKMSHAEALKTLGDSLHVALELRLFT